MEGIMLVPPDRGTIIGRALWKPRFVVVGPQRRGENAAGRVPSPKDAPGDLEATFLSVYKSRSDWEPIQQHHIGSITDCQVQMVAHRKQGPTLPTLVLTLSPDPATDKLRKRRSSRSAGLTSSSKDLPSNSLWFRPGDDTLSLQDWARFIHAHMQTQAMLPMSPLTPASPTFMNPFAPTPRQREPSEYSHRPLSGNQNARSGGSSIYQKPSTQSYSGRERTVTYSDSPSLRSKRSDISSHASVMNQSHVAYSHYSGIRPADLPSPAPTVQDYQGELIEGWTTAQGRSSTLSSPVRGRDSIGSQMIPPVLPTIDSSSPPGPRETILDRAFHMRCIPGSDRELPGEEKLSSLARFDALMKEMDKKREHRETEERKTRPPPLEPIQSSWDLEEEDSDEDDLNDADDADRSVDDDRRSHSSRIYDRGAQNRRPAHDQVHEADLGEDLIMPPTTQRALDFITGRQSPALVGGGRGRAMGQSSPDDYNPDHLVPMNSGFSRQHLLRPDAGPPPRRNMSGIAQNRTYSQPQVAAAAAAAAAHIHSRMAPLGNIGFSRGAADSSQGDNSCSSLDTALMAGPALSSASSSQLNSPLSVKSPVTDLGPMTMGRRNTTATTAEKRLSASSTKRISFTEQLSRRLSSTSSLLLVQTNVSASGSRGSSGGSPSGTADNSTDPSPYHQPQPATNRPPPPERCGWRGSVGMVGSTEGDFL